MTAKVMRPSVTVPGLARVKEATDWQSSSHTVVERFQKLFELAEWADCKFLVGPGTDEPRTEFPCHKLVLAASSPVFEALFYGPLAIQHGEPVVLPDMDPDHFQLFIKYLYTDTLKIPDVYTAQGILYAAKKYLIPHLATRCLRYLESNLTIDNLLDTLRTAECLKETKLRKQCLKLMCRTYPLQWWISELKTKGSSLSASSLSILLHTLPLPDKELGLFNLLLTWAQASCNSQNLEPNPKQLRLLLNQCNLLSWVRFLDMSQVEFTQVKGTGIFSPDEWNQVSLFLLETANSIESKNEALFTLSKEQTFMRATMSNKTSYVYGRRGEVFQCRFISDLSVLVTGFTMYTRLPYTNDYSNNSLDHTSYEEQLKVTVKDNNLLPMSSFKYHNPRVQYNSSIHIKLDQPFWTEPKKSYYIVVGTERGQYPSQDLSNVVMRSQDRIVFEEKVTDTVPDSSSETKSVPCGLIAALSCQIRVLDEEILMREDY